MNESIETVILEEGEIRITNRRVIIGTKSYPLADVNSVRIAKVGSTAGCVTAVLMGVGVMLGVLSFASQSNSSEYGVAALLIIASALVVMLTAKPNYTIQIRSKSGRADILESMDQEYLKRILDALDSAGVMQVE